MPSSPPDFSNLSAVFINATLKRSPDPSNTDGLITKSADIMRSHGVAVTEAIIASARRGAATRLRRGSIPT